MKALLDPRFILALFWSLFCALSIGYIIVHYGDDKNILLLIIGFLTGGVMGGIMGVYFNGSNEKKDHTPGTTITDATIKTVTTTPPPENASPTTLNI